MTSDDVIKPKLISQTSTNKAQCPHPSCHRGPPQSWCCPGAARQPRWCRWPASHCHSSPWSSWPCPSKQSHSDHPAGCPAVTRASGTVNRGKNIRRQNSWHKNGIKSLKLLTEMWRDGYFAVDLLNLYIHYYTLFKTGILNLADQKTVYIKTEFFNSSLCFHNLLHGNKTSLKTEVHCKDQSKGIHTSDEEYVNTFIFKSAIWCSMFEINVANQN